jgi:hypothetical protein
MERKAIPATGGLATEATAAGGGAKREVSRSVYHVASGSSRRGMKA